VEPVTEPLPRLLVIIGSGETSPTMSKVHRELFARLPASAGPAVMLDTPFGFQENADDVAEKAVTYFREAVNQDVSVVSLRSAAEMDAVALETVQTRLREARWVFSGPGSPSYALNQWRGTQVPTLLADKLRTGGCLIFASAAAVTLGPFSLPVYEIYKVGEAPRWMDGLDLIAAVGLRAVVIPHYNNAEGGRHDTRYCYVGERRLRVLEAQLPEDVFVLGVDEHTAAIVDLDTQSVTVAGLGGLTVRYRDRSERVESGQTVSVECVRELATGMAQGGAVSGGAAVVVASTDAGLDVSASSQPGLARSPLLDDIARLEKSFSEALAGRDARAAVGSILELDDLLVDWSRDTLQSDELDRGRAALRSMVVRLGEAAEAGVRDPRQVVAPFVDALLEARARARADRRWADADELRDALVAAGVEVRDTPEGTEWQVG
jgi:cyanophycinase-like exopeptidase